MSDKFASLVRCLCRLDFNGDDEKALVEEVFTSAIAALTEEDQTLPQVVTILPLLKVWYRYHSLLAGCSSHFVRSRTERDWNSPRRSFANPEGSY
jgi:hypothetical protein